MRSAGAALAFLVLAFGAGTTRAENDGPLRDNPAATAKPAVDPQPTGAVRRRPRAAAVDTKPANVAGGVVRYEKPVMRNGRMVTWRGAWRDRKGSGRAALAARAKPERQDRSERPALRAAAPAVAAAGAAADGETTQPVKITVAADPAAAAALAELGKALAPGGVSLEPVDPRAEADVALMHGDAFRADAASASGWVALARLFDCEAHVVTIGPARAIGDLSGKRVDVGAAGSAGAATARRIFALIGVAATFHEASAEESMRRLARGETDAVVVIAPRPTLASAPKGSSLVSIPYPAALRDAFLPAELTQADLPQLVAGQPIDTVSIPALLVARPPAAESERQRKLERLAEALPAAATRLGGQPTRLQSKWQHANFAARTGLPAFAPAR